MNHEDNDPVPATGNGSLTTAETMNEMLSRINVVLRDMYFYWVNDKTLLLNKISRLEREVRELKGQNARH